MPTTVVILSGIICQVFLYQSIVAQLTSIVPTPPTPPVPFCGDAVDASGVSPCESLWDMCNNSLLMPFMNISCRNTCGLCPTPPTIAPTTRRPPCVDNALPGMVSDCLGKEDLCADDDYKELMEEQCPRTCGVCDPNERTDGCVDFAPPNKRSSCPMNRHLCFDTMFESFMKRYCRYTCKYCPGDCVDEVAEDGTSDCSKYKAYCRHPDYEEFMKTECRATCGFC
ncbi:hypothetical protein AB6A40_001764 [Gnathostoma spinigerum]|uniref:ShKT domain-containing protein n=1 Tax=Gnathostoma spinigerum TaxID=75299 RepID=A0ABD6E5Y4_9BILA